MRKRFNLREIGLCFAMTIAGFNTTSNLRASIISDNLSNLSSGTESASNNRTLAASFTTDSSVHELTSVTLLLANTLLGTAELEIHRGAGLEPDEYVASLTSPVSYTGTLSPTTFLGGNISLEPNTTYWAVLNVLGGTFAWSWTTDNIGVGTSYDGTWGVSEDGWGGSLGENEAWFTFDNYPTQMTVVVDEIAGPVPTLSQWGMCVLVLFMLTSATLIVRQRATNDAHNLCVA